MLEVVIAPMGAEETQQIAPSDREYLESLRSKKRIRESATWRGVLRERLQKLGCEAARQEIRYNEVGAPYIEGSELKFSVSHSSEFVAVIVSDSRCAIDIESTERDFERVARRYVTEEESKLESGEMPLLALLWSAKETLYKYSGRSGLDFLSDLRITGIDSEAQSMEGMIGHEATPQLKYMLHENHVVVYI